ncbi:MAG: alpha-2-macroglobulin, partial [Planctomyces sp.]
GNAEQTVEIEAGGEKRVDWNVQVIASGTTKVRMKALTDEESDATELSIPVQVHGMLKTESYTGVIRGNAESGTVTIRVPAERIEEQSRLEVRYSPSLAGAMVDALPYLIDYPYGCTEQTLNRFLPAVITQRTLQNMGIDLADVGKKRTNLNSQQLGDPAKRAADWKQYDRNPIFDDAEMQTIIRTGVQRLTDMQLSDGGWGWFSGYGEHSSAHLTAQVVHGLKLAMQNDVPVLEDVPQRGIQWLKNYQAEQLALLREGDRRRERDAERAKNPSGKFDDASRNIPFKMQADDLDAFV